MNANAKANPFKNQKLTNVMKNAKATQTVNNGVWKPKVIDEMPNKQPKEWDIPTIDEVPNKQPKEWDIPTIDEVPNKQPKEWEVHVTDEMPELPTVKIPEPFKKPWKVKEVDMENIDTRRVWKDGKKDVNGSRNQKKWWRAKVERSY